MDEKQELMLQIVDFLIKYLSEMRKFPYVCQTEKYNSLGIKVLQ